MRHARGRFLPLYRHDDSLVTLVGDAAIAPVTEAVGKRTGLRANLVQGEFGKVERLIQSTYGAPASSVLDQLAEQTVELSQDIERQKSPTSLLKSLLSSAIKRRVTDVHVSPSGKSCHILFRVDGVLQPVIAIPNDVTGRLVSYIKLTAEMDIAEQRRPQDGSYRDTIAGVPVVVRVSSMVTNFGERLVLRLLPESDDSRHLGDLGFFEEDVALLSRLMCRPSGLVLITGPTGSGKSSTLHAGLRMQQLIERNVLTVEDPIEIRVPGAGQTEVNRKAGYDFGKALRHMLRHDPDVILVGEMRDDETAKAAFDASSTGHLVLSTLHVTSVFGVLSRLVPMGVQPQVIAENLLLVLNQRLVRKLCESCKQPEHSREIKRSG
ncbi:type II/IV secretion system protein [Piscinibacter aquaticus]|uniref:Type II/IV secretion system protein n=1 Tax=Piscinibacter aquaticus TaxID=392597 RepID=A0A5C6TPC1_9BURK|nr:type II/IV secretion system protein [Piscinibacter aquaticus]